MSNKKNDLEELYDITEKLVGPNGCPWDQVQTHESLKPYLIEETYELIDAINENSDEKIKEELGDHLFQSFLHAAIRKKNGGWDIFDVARSHLDKLIRRHPHIFGEKSAATPQEALSLWNEVKQKEKASNNRENILKDQKYLPSLLRSYKVHSQASKLGFEWRNLEESVEKIEEELEELKEAIKENNREKIIDEFGDLLLSLTNFANMENIEPESALNHAIQKFCNRFEHVCQIADKNLNELTFTEWRELWKKAKIIYP